MIITHGNGLSGGMPDPSTYVSDLKTFYVTASGTLTCPADIQSIDGFGLTLDFLFQGAGASGAANGANPNSGGTGGAWKIRYNWPIPLNRQIGVTMGSPGAGVSGAAGNNGGDSYWDTANLNLFIEGGHAGIVNNNNYNIPQQPAGHDGGDFQGLMFLDGKSIDGWPGGSVRNVQDTFFGRGGNAAFHISGDNRTGTRTQAAGGASLLSPGGPAGDNGAVSPSQGHSWGAGTGAADAGSSRTAGPGIVIIRYRSAGVITIA